MNLSNLTQSQLRELGDLCARIVPLINIASTQRGCGTCGHWVDGARCEKWQETPPTEVQRLGCDEWYFDDIPF